jgi:hypothetical protein
MPPLGAEMNGLDSCLFASKMRKGVNLQGYIHKIETFNFYLQISYAKMTELFSFDEMYNDEDELHIKSQNSIKNYFEIESELIETKTKLQVLDDKFTNLERLCFGTQNLMDIFRQNNEKYKQKEKEEEQKNKEEEQKNKEEEQKEKEEFKEKINEIEKTITRWEKRIGRIRNDHEDELFKIDIIYQDEQNLEKKLNKIEERIVLLEEKYNQKNKEKEEFKDINKKLEERIVMLEEKLYREDTKFNNVEDYVEKFYESKPKYSIIPIDNQLVDINAQEMIIGIGRCISADGRVTPEYGISIDGIGLPKKCFNKQFLQQFKNINKIIINGSEPCNFDNNFIENLLSIISIDIEIQVDARLQYLNESYILLFNNLLNNYRVSNLNVQALYGAQEKGQLVTKPTYLNNFTPLNIYNGTRFECSVKCIQFDLHRPMTQNNLGI